MSAKVFLNDQDIIETIMIGESTGEDQRYIIDTMRTLLNDLQAAGKPGLILVNTEQMKRGKQKDRKRTLDEFRALPPNKLAAYGLKNAYAKIITNFAARAMGMEDRFQFFSSREEAVAWLKTT